MTQDLQQQLLRRYLLGDPLEAERRRAIEERLLTDDNFSEQIEIIEDELIDEYLGEELSSDERVQFEHNFLSTTERRQKFSVARSLNRYAAANTSTNAATTNDVDPNPTKIRAQGKPIVKPALPSVWSRSPATVYVGLAAALVIVILAGLLWRSYSR